MTNTTSISFHNRKEGDPIKPFISLKINETYMKVFAIITSLACLAVVLFLHSI